MAPLDWIALAVLLLSLLIGLVRGLVFETILLAGWVAAFLAAQWWAEPVAAWLPLGQTPATWRYAAGFVLVFVAVAFAAGLLAALLRRLVLASGLRPVDRLLGGVFGAARGAVALLALAVVVHVMAWQQGPLWREAQSAQVLDAVLRRLKPALPDKLASYLP